MVEVKTWLTYGSTSPTGLRAPQNLFDTAICPPFTQLFS
jgi:hypothetical protein